MANTYVDYTGDNSETDFIFNFDYLQDDHVKVKVNDVIVTNYSIVEVSADNVIRFDTAPASNASIRIYRDSRGDFSPLVGFVDGSVLTGDNLDEAYKHNLFVSQEASEGTGNELLNKKGGANYDAEGNKIINLGTPTTGTDAANKGYVDQTIDNSIALGGSPAIVSLGGYDVTALGTSITKSLANWTNDLNSPTATGSTAARSLSDRFADVVNVLDFGAYNDGSNPTDTTTAIQAAIDYAMARTKSVFIPSGTYLINAPLYVTPDSTFTEQTVKIYGEVKARHFNSGSIIKREDDGDVFRLNCEVGTTNKAITNGLLYFQIHDLMLLSTSTEGSGSHGIFARTTRWSQFKDLRIRGFDRAIEIYSTGDYSDFNEFRRIHIDCYRSGIRNRSADDCIIENIYQLTSNTHNPQDQEDALVTIKGGFRPKINVITGSSYSSLTANTINPVISIQETEGASVSGHCEESDYKPFIRGLYNKSLKIHDLHMASNAGTLGTKIYLYACPEVRLENCHFVTETGAASSQIINLLDSSSEPLVENQQTSIGFETGSLLDDRGTLKDVPIFNQNNANYIVRKPSFLGLGTGNFLRPLLQQQGTNDNGDTSYSLPRSVKTLARNIRDGDTTTRAFEDNQTFRYTNVTSGVWKSVANISVANSSKSLTWELQVQWYDVTNTESGSYNVYAHASRSAGLTTAKSISSASLGGTTTLAGFGVQFGAVTGGVTDTQDFDIQLQHTAGGTVYFFVSSIRKVGFSAVTCTLLSD